MTLLARLPHRLVHRARRFAAIHLSLRPLSALPIAALAIFAIFTSLRADAFHPRSQDASSAANAQSVSAVHTVTFNRDIAPIFFHSCAPCHRPGEAGPFSLLTYEDAKSHAKAKSAKPSSKHHQPSRHKPRAAKGPKKSKEPSSTGKSPSDAKSPGSERSTAGNSEPAAGGGEPAPNKTYTDDEALACSIENPESCEACQ